MEAPKPAQTSKEYFAAIANMKTYPKKFNIKVQPQAEILAVKNE